MVWWGKSWHIQKGLKTNIVRRDYLEIIRDDNLSRQRSPTCQHPLPRNSPQQVAKPLTTVSEHWKLIQGLQQPDSINWQNRLN